MSTNRLDEVRKRYTGTGYNVTESKIAPQQVSNVRKSFMNPNLITDPTSVGFRLFFHFADTAGLLAAESYTNSALAYLKRINEMHRYELLLKFIEQLSNLNSVHHFLYKRLDGLEELLDVKVGLMPERGNKLTLQCLETIDWKIQSLLSLYQLIAYDGIRGVEVLPENLRMFSMSVYIYDSVILFDEDAGSDGRSTSLIAPTAKTVNDVSKLKHIMFDLGYCEFDSHNSGKTFLGAVSNETMEPTGNNIVINYKRVHTSSLFMAILGENVANDTTLNFVKTAQSKDPARRNRFKEIWKTVSSPFYKAVEDLKDKYPNLDAVKKTANVFAKDLLDFGQSQLTNALRARVDRLFLGNVYQIDAGDILRFAKSENFLQQFSNMSQIISQGGNKKFKRDGDTKKGDPRANAYYNNRFR